MEIQDCGASSQEYVGVEFDGGNGSRDRMRPMNTMGHDRSRLPNSTYRALNKIEAIRRGSEEPSQPQTMIYRFSRRWWGIEERRG